MYLTAARQGSLDSLRLACGLPEIGCTRALRGAVEIRDFRPLRERILADRPGVRRTPNRASAFLGSRCRKEDPQLRDRSATRRLVCAELHVGGEAPVFFRRRQGRGACLHTSGGALVWCPRASTLYTPAGPTDAYSDLVDCSVCGTRPETSGLCSAANDSLSSARPRRSTLRSLAQFASALDSAGCGPRPCNRS